MNRNGLNALVDFLKLRYSFDLYTELNEEQVRKVLYSRIKRDNSFLSYFFIRNAFGFSHKNFMPSFFGFSPVWFTGKIKAGDLTHVKINTGFQIVLALPYFLSFLILILDYHLGIFGGGTFVELPLAFLLFLIFLPHLYFAFKINDVKQILKQLL